MNKLPLSIIVPTLNEADNLPFLFERIDATLSAASIPYEIVVVDDHSSDGTAAVAQAAYERYNVRLLYKQGRRGKAFSLLEGFEAASHHLVCMIDADLQYPPEEIPVMYDKLQHGPVDIVVTERVNNQTSGLRRLSTTVFNLLFVRLLFGINYDTQSGLKLFKKKVLSNINLTPSAWSFDLEFIVRSLEQDYTIANHQIPFGERYAGVPKVKMLSATTELIKASIKLRHQTAAKRVRFSYNRNLYLLQRSSSWLITLLAATFVVTFLHAGTASALKLHINNPLTRTNITKTQAKNDTSTTSSTPTSNAPTTSAATTAAAPPAATLASSATPATATTSTASNTQAITPSNGQANSPAASPVTNTSSLSRPIQSKNATYYPASKLSQTTTQKFLNLALRLVEVGGGFIGFSLIVLISKRLTKGQRQVIKSYSS